MTLIEAVDDAYEQETNNLISVEDMTTTLSNLGYPINVEQLLWIMPNTINKSSKDIKLSRDDFVEMVSFIHKNAFATFGSILSGLDTCSTCILKRMVIFSEVLKILDKEGGLSIDKMSEMKEVFEFIDTDGDSVISVSDLLKRLQNSENVNSEDDIREMMHRFHNQKGDFITFQEYLTAMTNKLSDPLTDREINSAFDTCQSFNKWVVR